MARIIQFGPQIRLLFLCSAASLWLALSLFLLRLRRSPVDILLQVPMAAAALANLCVKIHILILKLKLTKRSSNLVGHLVSLLCPKVYFSLRLCPTPGPTAGPDEVEDVFLPQGEALLVHQLGPVAAVVGAGDSDRLLDIER